MTTLAGFLGYTVLQILVICAVFAALCDLCKRTFGLGDRLLVFCAGVFSLGALGYGSFWLAYASYPVFGALKIVLLAVLLVYAAWMAWRRLRELRWLAEPLLFTVLFFVVVLSLGFSAGGIDNPVLTSRGRFSQLLPEDNILPLIVAMELRAGHIGSPLVGDWLASDRPPLQSGLYLLLTLRHHLLAYQVVASFLQATYLFGAWGLMIAAALLPPARRLTMLACCLFPVAIINTFFTWPKLLAAGYVLLTFALVFRPRPPDERPAAAGVLIGGLAALAVLSHGSSAFALIGFAIAVVLFWAWPSVKTMVAAAATLAALYVTWILYQRFIDPPGDRLLKWHLAGVIDVDQRGLFTTLRESYAALSWRDYSTGKLENLKALIGTWPANLAEIARLVAGDAGIAPAVRIADFFQFLPSLHVFSLALIVALVLLPFMRADERPQRDFALRMIVALTAIFANFVILIFIPGQTINHVGTYASHIMATAFAIAVLSVRAPALALGFVGLQTITISAVYVVTIPHDPAFWPLWITGIAAAGGLFAYSLAPTWTRWRRREQAITG
ncbi:MAG: hypothetical protein QOG38_817 [Hyphomicrobiales bacterium]|jgi:hypothetical protein|nr:hypothetical protein [Hyphomicrobiales bacterium]